MNDLTHTESSSGEDDIGRALALLLRSHRERVGSVVGAFPQGSRGYQVLAQVIRGDPPSQLALAKHLGIDRTVMTYMVDDLEQAGLVQRRANPHDRRQRQIVATSAGQKAVAELCQRVAEAEDALLMTLTSDERVHLRRLLRKAACGIGGDVEDPCEAD